MNTEKVKNLRVALFTGNYNHISDGVSLTLNRWVAYLESQGASVLVFGPTIDQPQVQHQGRLIAVPSIAAAGRPEYRISLGFPKSARKKLDDFNPNLIHIATPDVLGKRARSWALKRNKPIVASYHTHFSSYLGYYHLQFLEPLLWKYLASFYRPCKHIYVPSKSMVDVLRQHGINQGLKIWARGVETDRFTPDRRDESWRAEMGFEKEDRVLCFVSRLVWEKDLKTVIETIKKIEESGSLIKTLIVGDGPACQEMESKLPKTVFTGYLTGTDLAKAYASADIFFFPSDTETFGNVTLEALSCGLPAVVADATGSKSLVEDGKNGFIVPPKNPDAFAERILQLAENKTLRTSMAKAARRFALNFSWPAINAGLLHNYLEVLEGTGE